MKLLSLFALAAAATIATTDAASVPMTSDIFNDALSEKNVFVKYQAPWCGHCKAMKPAWEELGEKFADSEAVVIGDVDCTLDHNKSFCQEQGVSGYPTIKYYIKGEGKDYNGGRDIAALETHVKDNMLEVCTVDNRDCWDERALNFIDTHSKKDVAGLEKAAAVLAKGMKQRMNKTRRMWWSSRAGIIKQLLKKARAAAVEDAKDL